MRIAVDAMGGDHAPSEIIEGALIAAKEHPDWQIILVGKEDRLPKQSLYPANVRTYPAGSVMAMDESVEHLRQKKDSSIWVATQLVKEGEADAVVSAGSTGAQMASALLQFGRIKGIERPAVCVVFPTFNGGKIVLDTGANVDVKPQQLFQFALMGDVYSQAIFHVENPRIALLSNGTEEHKGTELVQQTHEMLKNSNLNFIGNVEGRDISYGEYDVLVTDGFTGNVVLKLAEGLSKVLFTQMKREFKSNLRSKLGAALIKPALMNLKKAMDYAEYGGAPLVGVKGISIVCHGSSNSIAIKNAIGVAGKLVEADFIGHITEKVAKLQMQ